MSSWNQQHLGQPRHVHLQGRPEPSLLGSPASPVWGQAPEPLSAPPPTALVGTRSQRGRGSPDLTMLLVKAEPAHLWQHRKLWETSATPGDTGAWVVQGVAPEGDQGQEHLGPRGTHHHDHTPAKCSCIH